MQRVTDIKQQKNNQNKFSIFLDGEYRFSLYYEDLVHYGLKIGDDVDDSLYDEMYDRGVFSKAKKKALNFLGYKMRTEQEIRLKLLDCDFEDDVVDDVILFLKKYNYVNDMEYAKCYIKEKSKLKMYGKYKLSYDLSTKGISEDLYSDILDQVNYDETAYELVCKKLRKKLDIDEKTKTAVFNHLIRKGYTYEQAKNALKRYFEEN